MFTCCFVLAQLFIGLPGISVAEMDESIERPDVHAAVAERLAGNGVVIIPNSPVRIALTIESIDVIPATGGYLFIVTLAAWADAKLVSTGRKLSVPIWQKHAVIATTRLHATDDLVDAADRLADSFSIAWLKDTRQGGVQ